MKNRIKNFIADKIQSLKKVRQEVEEDDLRDLSLMNEEEHEDTVNTIKSLWTLKKSEDGPSFLEKLKNHRNMLRNRWVIIGLVAAIAALGLYVFSLIYVAEGYTVVSSAKRNDISGTKYENFGKRLLKYSSDGVSCLDGSEEVLWSSTYSMQTPILDICGTTAAVAEKDGTQVFVYNGEGLLGQFKTLLPIEKIRVAEQGVVSVVLEDGDNTWINFYDANGELIAENRTSIEESGYPLDVDLAPDGLKLVVSYLQTMEGSIRTNVSFYNFDSVGKAETNNLVSSFSYENVVVPEVRFVDENTAVAFRGDGFSVYKGKQIPEETDSVTFESEVLSVFSDDSKLGFVFASDDKEYKYQMQLYNLNGKRTMQKYFDFSYRNIKLDGSRILMSNDGEIVLYSTGGRLKGQIKYKTSFEDVISVQGFRKYLVLTQENADVIRLK